MVLKSLLQLVIVIAAALLTWQQLLSAGQRQWLLIAVGLEQPPQTKPAMATPVPDTDTTPAKPDSLAANFHTNVISQHFNCSKPGTEVITEAPGNQVHSWIDAAGKQHFSDQPPVGYPSQNLSQQYAAETEYFKLEVTSPEGAVAPLLQEQIHRDVVAIYRYLQERLALDHLRKVTVRLQVFNKLQNYRAYQQLHAPMLQGSAGFYSAVTNEAVVLSQADPELTRRIARHESTHVIMAGLYGMTPIWLNEGLAEVFADYRNKALSRQFDWHPGRWEQIRRMLNSASLLSLEELLDLNPQQWQQTNPAKVYPAAWALVGFMLHNTQARAVLLAILQRLASEPCAEIRASSFIVEHFPGGTNSFELQWHAWLRQQLAQ